MLFPSTYSPRLESNVTALQPTSPSSAGIQTGRSSAEVYFSLICYALLSIIILAGNGLVVSAYVLNKWLRRAVTHTLIIGLAMADLLVGLVSLPIWMCITFWNHSGHQFNKQVYQLYITADIFIGSASILQLTGIGIERSHAILRPFKHRLLRPRTFYIAVVFMWMFSAVLASLQPLQYGTDWQMPYTILTATVCFFIPVLVIISAYSSILVAAMTRKPLSQHRRHTSSLEKEIRLCVTVALVSLLFIMAWLPLFTLTILATFEPEALPSPLIFARLLHFVKWMHYSSSALNPFLYSYRNTDLRWTISVLLRRLVSRRGPGVNELFRRQTVSTVSLRTLSTSSDQSRKMSTGSEQFSPRARSESVWSWTSIRRHGRLSEKKEIEYGSAAGNNNI